MMRGRAATRERRRPHIDGCYNTRIRPQNDAVHNDMYTYYVRTHIHRNSTYYYTLPPPLPDGRIQ